MIKTMLISRSSARVPLRPSTTITRDKTRQDTHKAPRPATSGAVIRSPAAGIEWVAWNSRGVTSPLAVARWTGDGLSVPQSRRWLIPPVTALVAALAAGPAAVAEPVLNPPLGLHWGDSPESLIAWSSKHALDVTIHLPGKQRDLRVLRIAAAAGPLPGLPAREVEARFLAGRLIEVALHYHDPDANAEVIEARFEKLKRQLTTEFGPLTPNRVDRSVTDGFTTRRVSLHREPVRGLFLLLAFTEVEDTVRKSRQARFTLVYRNENLRSRIEEELAAARQEPPP